MKTRLFLLLAVSAVLGIVAGYLYWKPAPVPMELETTLLPTPRPLERFALSDHRNQTLGPERLTGRWSLVYFGYTHCPDICPTTLNTLAGLERRLAESGQGNTLQYLFVSVDPKRDSLEYLQNYMRFFHPDFIGATGPREEIDRLGRQFGAIYMFEGDTNSDSYIVNHSATLFVVDPEGRYYARIPPPHDVGGLLKTLERLRNFHDH